MKLKKYTEEQLKEMPLTEIAYLYISGLKRPVGFNKLTDIVFTTAGLNDDRAEKMGQFYTDLTVDGRFVTFSNGKWDLRYRHRFEAFDWEEEEYEDYEDYEGEAETDGEIEVSAFAPDTTAEDFDEDEEKIDVSKIVNKPNDEFDDELE